jgi:nitrogen fixation protein NifX
MSTLSRKLEVLGSERKALLKVAFASTDRSVVDQHFGSAKGFVVYGINPDEIMLLNIAEFGELEQNGNEDKLIDKLELLDGCIAVYCRACGASAVKQLLAKGIQPVKVTEGALIKNLLSELQRELLEGPSSWLAKAVSRNTLNASRFDEMEMEGWDE